MSVRDPQQQLLAQLDQLAAAQRDTRAEVSEGFSHNYDLVTGLAGKVAMRDMDVTRLQEQVSHIANRLGAVEHTQEGRDAQLGGLGARLQTLEGRFGDFKTATETFKTELQAAVERFKVELSASVAAAKVEMTAAVTAFKAELKEANRDRLNAFNALVGVLALLATALATYAAFKH